MKKTSLKVLVPGICAAVALLLAVSVGAQTAPPTPKPAPAPAPMMGHHHDRAAKAEHAADMKAECQAMMAKKQKMMDERLAMDTKLDQLVATMNAASTSKKPDAMEKPMAAVLTELVAQRKAMHSAMMEMQPEMMAHMMHHRDMQGTDGEMQCPMMKGDVAKPEAEPAKSKG